MSKKSRQKFKYFENEKRFQDEINSIFHHFLRAVIEGNKRNFFWKVRVRRYTFLQIRFQICCYLWGPGTVNLNIPKYFIQLNLYIYLVVYNMNWSRVKNFSFLSRAYVRSIFTCLRGLNHSQNILQLSSIPHIVVFLWIIWPFIQFKTPKLLLIKLHTPILSWGVLLSHVVHAQRQ